MNNATLIEFFSRCVKLQRKWNDSPCWAINGSATTGGYRMYRSALAHRVAWAAVKREVPGRLRILCGNKTCVNPAHMENGESYVCRTRTGRIARKVSDDIDTITAVLDARDAGLSVKQIALRLAVKECTVKEIFRTDVIHDVIRDAKAYAENDQPAPNEPMGDTLPCNRYLLSETTNVTQSTTCLNT